MTMKERIQEALDMQEQFMLEHHGRPDCKNCSLAEVIQAILLVSDNNDE